MKRFQTPFKVPEQTRIQLESLLNDFKGQCEITAGPLEYNFETTLSSEERRFLHNKAQELGLTSKSYGKEPNRYITVSKRTGDKESATKLELSLQSSAKISDLVKKHAVPNLTANPRKSLFMAVKQKLSPDNYCSKGTVPPVAFNRGMAKFRTELPAYSMRDKILGTVKASKVPVFIRGDTGCGKSTQVPQYLLEEAARNKEKVNIICAVPRRVAAVSLCDRVSFERGEPVGATIGYKVRLQSETSSKTALTFCTGGILLRSICDSSFLSGVSHLILDEIHERDKFTDFLLGYLHSELKNYPQLKVILMSANMDFKVFSNFFGVCPLIEIEGRVYPVKEFFLPEVLKLVGETVHNKRSKNKLKTVNESKWESYNTLRLILKEERKNHFKDLGILIEALVRRDLIDDIASLHELTEIADEEAFDQKLESFICGLANRSIPPETVLSETTDVTDQELVHDYLQRTTERADVMLITKLIVKIHCSVSDHGGILVFLPGLEDLVVLKHMLIRERGLQNIKIYLLHSSIEADKQRRVFEDVPRRVRKVILSTNIAETSITVADVTYVIDSGKVKEKVYDAETRCTSLQTKWTSRASADQRKGRAGRSHPGVCYHLYTFARFGAMEDFQPCEMVRSEIQELCLYSRTFLPKEVRIAEFFQHVPEPPSTISLDNAVTCLKEMGALDENELLTDLGIVLSKFPLEPSLAKMLLYSLVLKCVDPILTVASAICYRDPFMISAQDDNRSSSKRAKRLMAKGSFSDQIAIVNAFAEWINIRNFKIREKYCQENSLSHVTMIGLNRIRDQLAGILCSVVLKSARSVDRNYFNKYSLNLGVLKACLLIGFYPNICKLNDSKAFLFNKIDNRIKFHHASTLATGSPNMLKLPSDWVIYNELSRNQMISAVKDCTLVSAATISLFSAKVDVESYGQTSILKINDWIRIHAEKGQGLLLNLRAMFLQVAERFITTGRWNQVDDEIVDTMVAILSLEDMQYKENFAFEQDSQRS